MTKTKILIAITKSVWGGAQRYVYDLAQGLPSEKFEVVVVTGGEGPLTEKLLAAGIKTIALPELQAGARFLPTLFSLSNLFAPALLFKIFLKEKPEIIHFSGSKMIGLGGLAAFSYKLLTVNSKLLTVATVHGWPFKEERPWPAKAIIFFLNWLSMIFQNKIILISRADLESAKKFLSLKKLWFIPNGIKPPQFLEREAARKFFEEKIGKQLKPSDLVIGTIAELTPNKGQAYLLEALAKIKTKNRAIKLFTLLIGAGEEKAGLQRQIESLNIADMAYLAGFLENASRYLKGFDVFVLPSLKEGLPYALLEAMLAGTPVIAAETGGIPDLLDAESGIIIPPKNADALASALLFLLANPKKRVELAENAEREAQTKFSLEIMMKKTIACYES